MASKTQGTPQKQRRNRRRAAAELPRGGDGRFTAGQIEALTFEECLGIFERCWGEPFQARPDPELYSSTDPGAALMGGVASYLMELWFAKVGMPPDRRASDEEEAERHYDEAMARGALSPEALAFLDRVSPPDKLGRVRSNVAGGVALGVLQAMRQRHGEPLPPFFPPTMKELKRIRYSELEPKPFERFTEFVRFLVTESERPALKLLESSVKPDGPPPVLRPALTPRELAAHAILLGEARPEGGSSPAQVLRHVENRIRQVLRRIQ